MAMGVEDGRLSKIHFSKHSKTETFGAVDVVAIYKRFCARDAASKCFC